MSNSSKIPDNFTQCWTSEGTSWSGFKISQNHFVANHLPGKRYREQTRLFLTVGGNSMLTWTDSRKQLQKFCTPGVFFYVEKDCELSDVTLESTVDFIELDIDLNKINSWIKDDFSLKITSSNIIPSHIVDSDPYITRLMQSMRNDILGGCSTGRLFGETASVALVSYLYGFYKQAPSKRKPNKLSPFKRKILEEYIKSNISSDLSLSELANVAELSPRHFSRCFNDTVGMPPHQYVLHTRIELAKIMLSRTKRPITEIALELGFSSASHFSDAFRKITGMSPTKFLMDLL